jgi:DNA-binding MarR family transcriptional regulator
MRQNMRLISTRVDSLLSDHPGLTLQELAHTIGTDRHSIERAVKEGNGISFCALKRRYRIKRILTLLEARPGNSVKEIAAEVCLTPNYLSHIVISMTGNRATELRRHKS